MNAERASGAAVAGTSDAADPRPNFFIVGAPRSGTTAMYEYLRQHPDVFMPYRKEPVYFGADLTKRPPFLDEAGYLKLFKPGKGRQRLGEATVWYLYSETAAAEIKAFDPEARIVIMLRDPVEMIYSLHSHWLFTGNEDIEDFGEAIEAEEDRREGRRLPPDVRRPEGLQYRACARLASHVERYLHTFGPEAVKIIIYDDFSTDPGASYRDLLSFLGVSSEFEPDFEVVNQNKVARSSMLQRFRKGRAVGSVVNALPTPLQHAAWRLMKRANIRYQARPPIDPDLRARLVGELADDVSRLGKLVGRDLSAWAS